MGEADTQNGSPGERISILLAQKEVMDQMDSRRRPMVMVWRPSFQNIPVG